MKKQKEEELKEKAKNLSIKEGSAYSVMDGAGYRYITPFAIALQASNFIIGLITTLPNLIGSFTQLTTTSLMKKYSRKKIAVFFTSLQASLWIPLILIGLLFAKGVLSAKTAPILLLIIYSAIAVSGAIIGPAWNSWMQNLVEKDRGKYFAKRARINGIVGLISMIIAGIILHFMKSINLFVGFAIIFGAAFLGRLVSSFLFTKKYEPKYKYEEKSYFSFPQFLEKILFNNFGHFTIFISLTTFATAIASPFFAVYMLKDLQLSYLSFTLISLASAASTLFFLPVLGKAIDKYGSVKIMKISGLFIPLVPILWLAPEIIPGQIIIAYLIAIEIIAGIIWAGMNLAAGNFIFDAVTPQKISLCVTYFNILNAIGAVLGATIGGYLSSHNITILSIKSIIFVFILSAIVRFLVFIFIANKIKEVRPVKNLKIKQIPKKMSRALIVETYHITEHIGFKTLRTK